MSSRKNQRQIWADELFISRLEEIRAKRVLAGKSPIKNVGELTKMMCSTESFKNLEKEIINYDPLDMKRTNKKLKLKIRFDGGLF